MSYLNANLSKTEKALGLVSHLQLEYNYPIRLPQHYNVVCDKTTQNLSSLTIKNLSSAFALTVYIDPAPTTGPNPVTIAANDPTPVYIVQNYNGAKLSVANISQESASAEVTLTDLS